MDRKSQLKSALITGVAMSDEFNSAVQGALAALQERKAIEQAISTRIADRPACAAAVADARNALAAAETDLAIAQVDADLGKGGKVQQFEEAATIAGAAFQAADLSAQRLERVISGLEDRAAEADGKIAAADQVLKGELAAFRLDLRENTEATIRHAFAQLLPVLQQLQALDDVLGGHSDVGRFLKDLIVPTPNAFVSNQTDLCRDGMVLLNEFGPPVSLSAMPASDDVAAIKQRFVEVSSVLAALRSHRPYQRPRSSPGPASHSGSGDKFAPRPPWSPPKSTWDPKLTTYHPMNRAGPPFGSDQVAE